MNARRRCEYGRHLHLDLGDASGSVEPDSSLTMTPAAQIVVGTSTVMRQNTFRDYAAQAGYQSVEILPVESENFYFYGLTG